MRPEGQLAHTPTWSELYKLLDEEQYLQVVYLATHTKLIQAIKLFRSFTNMGLKESKWFVEVMQARWAMMPSVIQQTEDRIARRVTAKQELDKARLEHSDKIRNANHALVEAEARFREEMEG